MCHTRQCLVANCSTTEHQQWRRVGLQQLHTVTGGHDIQLMGQWRPHQTSSGWHVRQTSEVCSQIRWCSAFQWTIHDCRQLNTLRGFQPMETGECVTEWCGPSVAGRRCTLVVQTTVRYHRMMEVLTQSLIKTDWWSSVTFYGSL